MSAFSVQSGSIGVLFRWSTQTRECVNKINDLSLPVSVKRGFLTFCTTRLERWCAYQVRHWKSMSTYHVGVILKCIQCIDLCGKSVCDNVFFLSTQKGLLPFVLCLVCAIRVLFICDYYCFSTTVINHVY